MIAGAVVMNLEKLNIDRYRTLESLAEDYNATGEGGRMDIWKKGLELLATNPLTGVGVDCFSFAIGYMRSELHVLPKWQEAHNSYLQVASETRIVGFLLFLGLISTCFKNFTRLGETGPCGNTTTEPADLEAAASLLRTGLIGTLIVAFFLSQAYSVEFTAFFALSAILRQLAHSSGNTDKERDTVQRELSWGVERDVLADGVAAKKP